MSPVVLADSEGIGRAAECLRGGGVIAIPTDTVYGVVALAGDPAAVRRLYAVKRRPERQPVILLVSDAEQAAQLARCNDRAVQLMHRYWPGPLTLVLEPRRTMDAGQGEGATIAVRAPAHPAALELLRRLARPLASSSANHAGEPPPRDAAAVAVALGDEVDLILDGGPAALGQPSTILDLSGTEPRVIREGSLSRAQLLGPS
jgi:L-threonylcarbamoyladenylate synthase